MMGVIVLLNVQNYAKILQKEIIVITAPIVKMVINSFVAMIKMVMANGNVDPHTTKKDPDASNAKKAE
jgi:hypothetical protein